MVITQRYGSVAPSKRSSKPHHSDRFTLMSALYIFLFFYFLSDEGIPVVLIGLIRSEECPPCRPPQTPSVNEG